jgi:hypothetical protein
MTKQNPKKHRRKPKRNSNMTLILTHLPEAIRQALQQEPRVAASPLQAILTNLHAVNWPATIYTAMALTALVPTILAARQHNYHQAKEIFAKDCLHHILLALAYLLNAHR